MSSKRKLDNQHDKDEEIVVEHKKKKKKYVQFIEEYDEEVSISQEIADFDIPVSFRNGSYLFNITHERVNISFTTERDSLLLHKWILHSELKLQNNFSVISVSCNVAVRKAFVKN